MALERTLLVDFYIGDSANIVLNLPFAGLYNRNPSLSTMVAFRLFFLVCVHCTFIVSSSLYQAPCSCAIVD